VQSTYYASSFLFISQIMSSSRVLWISYTCTGPEDHHLSFLSRINVDGITGVSGTSIRLLDTGIEMMSFRSPIDI